MFKYCLHTAFSPLLQIEFISVDITYQLLNKV